ncbi:MAG: helix-turn-helix transcriptional regulator, partial [Saprospiraceae bacterium]|nr:helix-turn-helix transcriptional regulator [Saprospiraceae bacterium]MCB0683167.1 helix-turn-helix transcriptional regulator [Saprospiraceae bacterium]
NEQFSVSELAYRLAMSERHLQRRIRELTGLSPVMYIRQVRLQKARVLLETREYQTVAEVSFAVGFATPAYFSKLYKDAFGKSPSDYL